MVGLGHRAAALVLDEIFTWTALPASNTIPIGMERC